MAIESKPFIVRYDKTKDISTVDYFYIELVPRDNPPTPFLFEYEDAFNFIKENANVSDDRIQISAVEHPLSKYKDMPTLLVNIHRGT